MKKKILMFVLVFVLAFIPVATANALSVGGFEFYVPIYEFTVPDFTSVPPLKPILVTPSIGIDFRFLPVKPAVMHSLYTNDVFYVNSNFVSAPKDWFPPYEGIESGGVITFNYRYNKNIVKVANVAINTAFSMIGSTTYQTVDTATGTVETFFDVSIDEAHYNANIVNKVIAQVTFELLENGHGDSTIIASSWTGDAYNIKQTGVQDFGGGVIIPIFENIKENRANYKMLDFKVNSLAMNLKDSDGSLVIPTYQVPYPADNTVEAPSITGYKCTSETKLPIFDSLAQRRISAVFDYAKVTAPPIFTDITINCYFDMQPPPIYSEVVRYPDSGYVFAPNLESEGFTLLDDISYQKVKPGDKASFRYIENEVGMHTAYIKGYPDSTIKPEKEITREEMASILYRFITDPNKAKFTRTGKKFSDVALKNLVWGGVEIEYVANLGLFIGYPDGKFLPKKNITREEFVTVLTRLANYMPSTVPTIHTNNWSQEYVSLAVACGYTEGLENSPAGEKWLNAKWRTTPTTRAEVIVMFNNLFRRELSPASAGSKKSPFTDLSKSHWAYYDIIEATSTHNFNRNPDGSENHY